MKYIDEFRDQRLARQLAAAIAAEVDPARQYRLMEFCGGHTHAIFRYGVQQLMPPNLRFVHGPGCPVCVLPMARLDQAMAMTREHGVTLCTYGDLMRVPASGRQTLLKAKAAGADVRMIYSTQDVLRIARDEPERQVVFMAIGFETTTPPTAVAILQARAEGLKNLSFLCNHVLTPPALRAILSLAGPDGVRLDGILGPSHVSTVIGTRPYEFVPNQFGIPVVIAGFEPLDVMQSALMLVRQINDGRREVENQYSRAVGEVGNTRALELMARVFVTRPSFEWRGLGFLPESALALADDYADLDAERRFPVRVETSHEIKGCECPAILRGLKEPTECKLFGTVCTPDNPMGACMVSSEGACAAYWSHRTHMPSSGRN
ncbi:hydrogenase formation protein HypD [Allochromatium vinosum]|uniref:Hydrogenase maturation factor n=1 Tax=Allochromatium vinosum (strain ATCC 17899 / DSM 180 / NBRC 103801 / NCIMB 10441 / D) TaxID=572477 RepID=D3RQM2_ALLVD|nr:hydrogenase formation protein HypD [Allochromatium vinosum]ADC63706.1 hydrogenase expression/formation protein HypD [Allochromatium vinosum DSM 180]